MKFAVVASNRYKLHQYKEKLVDFNLNIKVAYDQICNDEDEACELLYIEVNTLEDLLKLKENVGHEIILKNSYFDALDNYYEEPTIEIYDDFRE